MSAGGIFQLIANDGKADAMIMATSLLNQRINAIMCSKAAQGAADPMPTLAEIEQTHILFVDAQYKPYAAIGYEYDTTKVNSGTTAYGDSIQYSIPQFGDFFFDMVVHVTLSEISATVGTVPAFPAYLGTQNQVTTATSSVSGTNNVTSGVYTQYTYEYVDIAGNVLSTGAPAQNYVRYAEYPGERLFKNVYFNVNGNPLDNYSSFTYIFHRKTRVGPWKLTGWQRLMGQEIPTSAYTDLVAVSGASNYPSSVVGLTDVNGNPSPAAPVTSSVTARKLVQFVSGPQTPQLTQPVLNLWIPLLFWFNTDVRLSIPSVSIPFGQRFITMDLDQQANIVFTAPGNLFLRLTVEEQYSTQTGAGTAAAIGVQTVNRWVTYTPTLATGSTLPAQSIAGATLYINNIFMNPEIHDIFISRIGFSLIRVHLTQTTTVSTNNGSILLSKLKYPVEFMFVGMRPTWNNSASNPNQYRDWHQLTYLTDNYVDVCANAHSTVMTDDTVPFNSESYKHKIATSMESAERFKFPSYQETIDTITITAQGVSLYDAYDSKFYRDYILYNYGGTNITTPQDLGVYMVNFSLFPGTYQPSGYINVSRCREFYIDYTSSYVSSTSTADLIVLASAINFLLIAEGSAVLRYTT
jgi:hypothetical protein